MEQIGFRMQLKAGQALEYQRRHDEIWPELQSLLQDAGISDYSIFLHEPTLSLFAVLRRSDSHSMDDLPQHPVMQRWWAHMADIMETHDNHEPMVEPLQRMFFMP